MLLNLLRAITYSNIWISAGASAFTLFFYWAFALEVNFIILAYIFSATLFTYTFQRVIKLRSKERVIGPRTEWMRSNPIFVNTTLGISLLTTLSLTFYLSWNAILVLIAMGTISIAYAVKINFGFGIKTNLRDIPGVKILLIALVWSMSCVVLPAIEANFYTFNLISFTGGVGLYIIGITIPFDIRDLDVDEVQKKTIPQIFGILKAKLISVLCIVAALVLVGYQTELDTTLLLPGIIISGILIMRSYTKSPELHYSALIDGLLIVLPSSYYLLNNL